MNVDGTNNQYLGLFGTDMSISPDGSKFVYRPEPTSWDTYYVLYVANIDGTNPKKLSAAANPGDGERNLCGRDAHLCRSEQGRRLGERPRN